MVDYLKCGKDDVIIKCGDVIHVLQESAMGLWWVIFYFLFILKRSKKYKTCSDVKDLADIDKTVDNYYYHV